MGLPVNANGLVALKLTKHYKNLNSGEVAGFPESEAEWILKQGGGELFKAAKPEAAAKPAAAEPAKK